MCLLQSLLLLKIFKQLYKSYCYTKQLNERHDVRFIALVFPTLYIYIIFQTGLKQTAKYFKYLLLHNIPLMGVVRYKRYN